MTALFKGIAKGAMTLATTGDPGEAALRALLPYAKSMNGKSHPHAVQVGDVTVLLSEADWAL